MAMPSQMLKPAEDFPDVTFIMGHMGFADFWYDAVPVASMAGNIMLETSLMDADNIERAIRTIGADRVLFGTDFPTSHPVLEQEKTGVLERLGTVIMEKILYQNASGIFGIQP